MLPLAAVIWSSTFAARHGCVLNEAGAHPCVVDGVDHGQTLAAAFISGWFMLLTIPAGLALLVLMIVFAVIDLVRARRSGKRED